MKSTSKQHGVPFGVGDVRLYTLRGRVADLVRHDRTTDKVGILMAKHFLVGAAVGSGVVARAAEDGGADFLVALNAGRLRSMGAPSIACMLPMTDAGSLTIDFAEREVLPQAKLPVYLGITSWSYDLNDEEQAKRLVDLGFEGGVNFPTCMHLPETMRRQLDRANLGVRRELALLKAVQAHGGKSLFYCGTKVDARMAAQAGIDGIVFNFGWNAGGMRGHQMTITLEEAALVARDVSRLVRRLSKRTRVFLEGGPIVTADDLSYVVRHADIDGYVGGSTIDRFPVQYSVVNQIAEYKLAAIQRGEREREVQAALTDLSRFGLVGETPAFAEFAVQLARAARNRTAMLLTGESGTDLSGAVEAILGLAGAAARQRTKFFDFAEAIPPHRMNEILFGRRGDQRPASGLLTGEARNVAVLLSCQAMPRLVARRLKTALRDGRAHAVGSRVPVGLVGRMVFVAETAAPSPMDEMKDGLLHLAFPPLRDRHADIKLILDQKLDEIGLAPNQRPFIRPAAYRVLMAHRWERNDAEVKALAIALARYAPATPIEANAMRELLEGKASERANRSLDDASRQQIVQALLQNGFQRTATARALGMSRKTLYNRMRRLGLQ